ncbi:phosphate uptake regulator, partial [Elusimicrobium simillimum]|uniref:PhoU domain-containing protein n=1 Tax=Elusimicrobium simillimum TaxID=3143438 RepID=UPI003C700F41
NNYLTSIAHERVSSTVLDEIMALIEVINSVERMGDSGENIAKLLVLARQSKEFSPEDIKSIDDMADLIKAAVKDARTSLLSVDSGKISAHELLRRAYEREGKNKYAAQQAA